MTFTRLVNTTLENKKSETIQNGISESNVAVVEFEEEIDKQVDFAKNTAELLKQAEFVIDENAFQNFLDSVVELSEGWSVDELCHLRAQLFFSVHNHRMDWDKADLLQVRWYQIERDYVFAVPDTDLSFSGSLSNSTTVFFSP